MPNRNLSAEELKKANELLADVRKRLKDLAMGDPLLLFAYRRKIAKELGYDERGKPVLVANSRPSNGDCRVAGARNVRKTCS